MAQKVRILFLLRTNVQINYFLYQIFLNPSSPERTGYFKRAGYQTLQMLSIFEGTLLRIGIKADATGIGILAPGVSVPNGLGPLIPVIRK